MTETTAQVRQEIAETRQELSETIGAIETRVSETVNGMKQKLDIMEWARQHPWPALAIALGLGLGLSASGADARAARATTSAVKRGPRAAKRWRERRRERAAEKAARRADEEASTPGAFGRVKQGIAERVHGGVDQIVGEMREAADELAPPSVQVETMRNGAWTNG